MSVKISLPNNGKKCIIDKDLQSTIKPLHIMETLLMSSKYKIRNDCIKTHCVSYHIVSFIATILKVLVSIYASMQAVEVYGKTNMLCFSIVYDTFYFSIGCCLNFYSNVTHRHSNIALLLKIQKVQRNFKISAIENVKINWYWFFVITSYYFIFVISFHHLYNLGDVTISLSLLFFICFDFNIIYVAKILNILCSSVKVWMQELQRSGYLARSEYECYWENMFEVFLEILEAYQLLQKTFEQLVSVHDPIINYNYSIGYISTIFS